MTIEDPVFGSLAWDDGFLAWKGKIAWPQTDGVEVLLDDAERASGFPIGRQSLEWFRMNEPYIRRLIVEDVLAWCNDTFGPDKPVNGAEFLRRVEPHQLRLEGDGSLWALYYDGHLFGGHVFWAEFGKDRNFLGVTSVD
jgi:hypothetical protein